MRLLVTGATGFIGRRLVARLQARGDTVVVLVHHPGRRAAAVAACAEGTAIITDDAVRAIVASVDAVVHLAGAVKAHAPSAYFAANAQRTGRLCAAIAAAARPPRLVYCSSLAAAGPATLDRPRHERDPVAPVSAYGRSKLAGEHALREIADRVPGVIIRPPIVYGPGDRAFLPAVLKMVRCGVVPTIGPGPRRYSLVHVDDVCRALIAATHRGATLSPDDPVSGVYTICDGVVHRLEEIAAALARVLGRRPPRRVRLPAMPVVAAAYALELVGWWRDEPSIFNRDKVREMRCDAWTCGYDRAACELGFKPRTMLAEGLAGWWEQR